MAFPRADLDSYGRRESLIGRGSHGMVYKHGTYAVKDLLEHDGEFLYENNSNEIINLIRLRDVPGVVQLVDICKRKDNRLSLVFPLYPSDLAKEMSGNTSSRIDFLILQLAINLHEIHRRGFVHLDIKPHNVLLTENGEPVMGDLGSLEYVPQGKRRRGVRTSLWWRAPENITNEIYNQASDIWSLGCLFAGLIIGNNLFSGKDKEDQYKQILGTIFCSSTKRSREFRGVIRQSGYLELILGMLSYKPQNRPNSFQVLSSLTGSLAKPKEFVPTSFVYYCRTRTDEQKRIILDFLNQCKDKSITMRTSHYTVLLFDHMNHTTHSLASEISSCYDISTSLTFLSEGKLDGNFPELSPEVSKDVLLNLRGVIPRMSFSEYMQDAVENLPSLVSYFSSRCIFFVPFTNLLLEHSAWKIRGGIVFLAYRKAEKQVPSEWKMFKEHSITIEEALDDLFLSCPNLQL